MDLQLAGKCAIISGGSSPIGRAAAIALAQEGVRVALAARTPDLLEAAVAEVRGASGGHVVGLQCDVTDDVSVERMVAEAAQTLGSVDILVNCASPRVRSGGGGLEAAFPKPEDVIAEMNVKVFGALRCARAVVPYMRAQGWGRIVNLSGTNGRTSGASGGSMRNASVVALTKNLADELGSLGINVTAVNPGVVRTEKTPDRAQRMGMTVEAFEASVGAESAIGRMVTAEEVAWVIAFLCSPRSVSISGDQVTVSGGWGKTIFY